MKYQEELIPNEILRHARILKGWSQAELAEKVGTSFEMVSRWERGVTVPSPRYRRQLCAVLGKSAEELGLIRDRADPFTPPSSPLVVFASSHVDAEKAPVSQLIIALQERGISPWSIHQSSKQITESSRTALQKTVQGAQAILVIVSPAAHSSRHVREAFEMARLYRRPVYGVWIEGEHWEHCLPEGHIELTALIDARERKMPSILEEIAIALEQVGHVAQNGTAVADPQPPDAGTEAAPVANEQQKHLTVQSQIAEVSPPPRYSLEPTNGAKPTPVTSPLPTKPAFPGKRKGQPRTKMALLVVLVILVVAGAVLGSTSLLAHFGLLGTRSGSSSVIPVRGGTWTDDLLTDPDSFIPGTSGPPSNGEVEQALYLPLFYGDAQGLIHPGAASEVPSLQNGGISPDGKIWTFHLRPHLIWSDGASYDARDVDFSWKLWRNPAFGFAGDPIGLTLITAADVSADHLTITFHLKRAYAPFVSNLWVDGSAAPLPMHHFSSMAPGAILKSPDNLNPKVTSGPFLMAESNPGDHYTLVRNPQYYLASRGLPYLDKVVFRPIASPDALLKDLQAGTITSFWPGSGVDQVPQFQHLKNYTLHTAPSSASFEAIFFNFHNTILASHQEVRQAMAMAIDQQALIQQAWYGVATPLCTDHGSAMHPGYDPNASFGCPVVFEPTVANQLLNDNGWVRGVDGVRAKGGQRLEFEYSTTLYQSARQNVEAILQRNFMAIGIKLDIQNYPGGTFFGPFLSGGKASPPTGAVAGRYDIAEYEWDFGYDPDDSGVLSCGQIPPNGQNYTFYCNHALDAFYQQELATVDAGVRQQLFIQIHQIYMAQFPFITLLSPSSFAIVRKGAHKYSLSPIVSAGETVNIAEWWCDSGQC